MCLCFNSTRVQNKLRFSTSKDSSSQQQHNGILLSIQVANSSSEGGKQNCLLQIGCSIQITESFQRPVRLQFARGWSQTIGESAQIFQKQKIREIVVLWTLKSFLTFFQNVNSNKQWGQHMCVASWVQETNDLRPAADWECHIINTGERTPLLPIITCSYLLLQQIVCGKKKSKKMSGRSLEFTKGRARILLEKFFFRHLRVAWLPRPPSQPQQPKQALTAVN